MIMSSDEAGKLITPTIQGKLRSSIISAFEDYNELDGLLRITLSPTTRANFINDRICYHIREKMSGMNGIDFIKRRGRLHLIIFGGEHDLEVKFKKLDFNRRPHNICTIESQDFMNQLQLEFPNMLHPMTNIVAGYQLNKTRTGIRGIFVVCPYGSQNKWEVEVPITAIAPVTQYSPTASNKEVIQLPRKKVVPKDRISKNVSLEG